jgi:hypothetical protein
MGMIKIIKIMEIKIKVKIKIEVKIIIITWSTYMVQMKQITYYNICL